MDAKNAYFGNSDLWYTVKVVRGFAENFISSNKNVATGRLVRVPIITEKKTERIKKIYLNPY